MTNERATEISTKIFKLAAEEGIKPIELYTILKIVCKSFEACHPEIDYKRLDEAISKNDKEVRAILEKTMGVH